MTCADEIIIQSLLTRSVSLALEVVGFEFADPVAIESFRADVQECKSRIHKISRTRRILLTLLDMAHFLADVRQSMLSSRRTRPVPQDFLQALHTHQLSLRSLIPHLDPPVPPSRSQFTLGIEAADDKTGQTLPFLEPTLNGVSDEQLKLYVPQHFPAFPSKHTYQATPEFPDREDDPRRIRERATGEARMGEEALRRLVGTTSDDVPVPKSETGLRSRGMRQERENLWRETMQILNTQDDRAVKDGEKDRQNGGHMGQLSKEASRISSVVNADKRFWRKAGTVRGSQRNKTSEAL